MFFNEVIEKLSRQDLNALVEERIRYTVKYASENSFFYKRWFQENGINPLTIRTHADLLKLPIVSGKTLRENQPPISQDFQFRSVDWSQVFTIHETSGTSGTPKTFFLTWEDWERFAEKYARIFVSQGFGPGDRVVICASYGMNVGANTMTFAANKIGMTIIPEGRCKFPIRVIMNYKPTALVGSVFKLLRLATEMKNEKVNPKDSCVERLVVGGESFAEESRAYLAEVWGCKVYNTYGSTEGTMCGECSQISGLHVPEDLVHLDIYDPRFSGFVKDGECGRIVLTTLIPAGGKCGTLLLNYDTEDTTVVVSRGKCACGRTHMRIMNPQRESETLWVAGTSFNRVDLERGVFQRDNMEYLTGEYEAFLYEGEIESETVMQVNLECIDEEKCESRLVEKNFLSGFLEFKPLLEEAYGKGTFKISVNFLGPKKLELYKRRGRPRRVVDRRQSVSRQN